MSALPWRILAQLEIAVLERQPTAEFTMAGEAPAWLQAVDSGFSQDGWRRADLHPVLSHFMPEANAFWSEGVARRRLCIAWKEDVANGELYLQATTMLVGGRALLLIERVTQARAEAATDLEPGDDNPIYSAAVQEAAVRQNLASYQLAFSDPLTALYNREGFERLASEQLQQAQRARQSLLLLVIEMDNYGAINQTLGHHMGDLALQRTASALRVVFRQTDIAGRLAGNEFAVLAQCDQQSHLEAIVRRLSDELLDFNSQADITFPLAVNIGCAWSRAEASSSLKTLMSAAGARAYTEKRGNKNNLRRASDWASPAA